MKLSLLHMLRALELGGVPLEKAIYVYMDVGELNMEGRC